MQHELNSFNNAKLASRRDSRRKAEMKRSHLIRVFLLIFLIIGTLPTPVRGSHSLEPSITKQTPAFVPGEILVKFYPGDVPSNQSLADLSVYKPEIYRLLNKAGVNLIDSQPLIPHRDRSGLGQVNSGKPVQFERIYRLRLSDNKDVSTVINQLSSSLYFESVEPNYFLQAAVVPNDNYYFQQWGLTQINASEAWDLEQGTDANTIAILDTGLDLNHPDFVGRLWTNPGETPDNGIDDDNNGYVDDINGWNFVEDNPISQDDSGHGTHVAGIAAANGDNGIGIAGVDWNARIMPLRILNAGGVGTHADAAAALIYAADKGTRVINMSFGAYSDSQILRDAVTYASPTTLLVGAAGNNGRTDPFYPAAYPQVLAVASTGPGDIRSAFSNYGSWVDISAPGETIWSTMYDDTYIAWSGSSMATPFVAGAASLILAHYPELSSASLRQQLLKTPSDVNASNPAIPGLLGAGRLDIYSALSTQPSPQLSLREYFVDGEISGAPEPASTVGITVTLVNSWADAFNVTGVLTSTSPFVSIENNTTTFGDIPGDGVLDNAIPFTITLSPLTPFNSSISFSIEVSATGAYSITLPFTITTASSLQNLGSLTINENTIWDSTRQFIIGEQVRVMEGVTLTIQSGVLLQFQPTGSLVVSGTLLADGEISAPIIFEGIGDGRWGGLIFNDSAEDAHLDTVDNYLGGSLLRHVQVKNSDTGVVLNAASPLIIDSIFSGNNTGLTIVGGNPLIRGNTFTNNGLGLVLSNSNQTRIINNLFEENTNGISGSGMAGLICQNRFIDNGVGISLETMGSTTVEENLIEKNTIGVSLSPNWPTGQRSNPDVAYITSQDESLVVWQDGRSTGGDRIYGQLLSGEGALIDQEIPIAVSGDNHNPHVACDPVGDACVAIYSPNEIINDSYQLNGQMISPSGTLSEAFLAIGTYTGTLSSSAVAANTNEGGYLVVWNDASDGDYDVYAQMVTASGMITGTRLTVIADSINQMDVAVTFNSVSNEYLVAWAENRGFLSAWDLYGRRVETNGAFAGIPFTLSAASGDQRYPALASETSLGWYTIVWDDNRNSRYDIYGRRVTGSGVLFGNDVQVFAAPSDVTDFGKPRIIFSPLSSEHIIIWNENLSSGNIVGQRVSSSGALVNLSSMFNLATNTANQKIGGIAFNDSRNEFLAVWQDMRNPVQMIYGQRFSPTGTLLDNPGTARDESNTEVNFPIVLGALFIHNTVVGNQTGLSVVVTDPDLVGAKANNLIQNTLYNAVNAGSGTLSLINNYWGYTELDEIVPTISGSLIISPALQIPDNISPAIFWRSFFSREGDPTPVEAQEGISYGPVGAEVLTLSFDFSKPMDTSKAPDITIGNGSTSIYTPTHMVSFGEWISPTRWVGQFQVDWYTGDGIKRVSIEGARDFSTGFSAPADRRFTFEVSILTTTSINAQPGWEQVSLSWPPANVSTLAGYNVYRATQSGGPYVQTNPTLLSTTTFTDIGLINYLPYFYKIGMVNTDLAERDYTEEFIVTPGDPTAPSTPMVSDDGICTPFSNWLHGSWNAIDPESGIVEYQYSIGTTLGGTQIINWTSVGHNISVWHSGLSLIEGRIYYFNVKAKNGAGAWSNIGSSDGIVVDSSCAIPGYTIYLPLVIRN